jgi:hypothetical protein
VKFPAFLAAPPSRAFEYLWLAAIVVILTPGLIWLFRNHLLLYGIAWLVPLTFGLASMRYPRLRMLSAGFFIALLLSLLMGMLPVGR